MDIDEIVVFAILSNKNVTDEFVEYVEKSQDENERLLNAVKLAYRKHHLDDPSIGWDELSDKLYCALCESMGDDGFVEWINEIMENKK